LDFSFPDLPLAFDGYKILHISDLYNGKLVVDP
jgi:predicted MPP superfamily phosphohydrolase